MGFLNTDSMPKLVEALADANNIKITGNSKGNRVGTVIDKIVEKADDVTKAIEQEVVNEGYSFKVGTGDVDVSLDVEDGFGEVGVKGVTYQNLISCARNITVEGTREWMNLQVHSSLVKPNTVYTLFFDIESISKGDNNYTPGVQAYSNNSQIIVSSAKPFTFQTNSDTTSVTLRLLVNSGTESTTVCKAIFKDIVLIEGNILNNSNLPAYFEGIVGVGDKSKNLFDISQQQTIGEWINQYGAMGSSTVSNTTGYIKVSPQTTLTLSVKENDTTSRAYCFFDIDKNVISGGSTYSNSATFTTPNNVEYIRFSYYKNAKYIQLEEGNMVTSYEPYYDGHKIEILSSGKNIFDKSTITDNSYIDGNGDVISYNGWFSSDFIRVHKGEKYYIYNEKHREPFAGLYSYYYDVNKNKIEYLNLGNFELVGIKEFVSKYDGYIRISGITRHIEKGKFYANSDKTQILLDEPLMKLPNGVCDEITRDGKLIRRIGKRVLNSDKDDIGLFNNSFIDKIETIDFFVPNNLQKENSIVICDKFKTVNSTYLSDDEGISGSGGNRMNLWFSVKKTRLLTQDIAGFKQWLIENPTTVYYELAKPIITDIIPPSLRIFKDGHLTFNTLVAPTSTHLVQLNKSAQIERSIREVQGLDGRVEKLESFYDDMILETSHKLNLLNYDFDYMRNTEDEI